MSGKAKTTRFQMFCIRLECTEPGPFTTEGDLWEHLYDAHGLERPRTRWACRAFCGASPFDAEADRDLHEISTHGGLVDVTVKSRSGALGLGSSMGTWVCAIDGCTESFRHKGVRGRHRNTAHSGWTPAAIDESALTGAEQESLTRARKERAAKEATQTPAPRPVGERTRRVREEGEDQMRVRADRFVCAVVSDDGETCTERFAGAQGRGAHRRHKHPGWTTDEVDVALLDEWERPDEAEAAAVTEAAGETKPAPEASEETYPDYERDPEPDYERDPEPDATAPAAMELGVLEREGWFVDLTDEQRSVLEAGAFLRDEPPIQILQALVDDAIAAVGGNEHVQALLAARESWARRQVEEAKAS